MISPIPLRFQGLKSSKIFWPRRGDASIKAGVAKDLGGGYPEARDVAVTLQCGGIPWRPLPPLRLASALRDRWTLRLVRRSDDAGTRLERTARTPREHVVPQWVRSQRPKGDMSSCVT